MAGTPLVTAAERPPHETPCVLTSRGRRIGLLALQSRLQSQLELIKQRLNPLVQPFLPEQLTVSPPARTGAQPIHRTGVALSKSRNSCLQAWE